MLKYPQPASAAPEDGLPTRIDYLHVRLGVVIVGFSAFNLERAHGPQIGWATISWVEGVWLRGRTMSTYLFPC